MTDYDAMAASYETDPPTSAEAVSVEVTPTAVCVFRCMDCGRVEIGPVNEREPEGWDYDDDESEFVCPDHASRLEPGAGEQPT